MAEKTVSSVVDFFERLITDFSWRRLTLVAGLLITVGVFFFTYELYTQSFRLTRLDRETALLERVLTLQRSVAGVEDPELLAALEGLKERVRAAMQAGSTTTVVVSPRVAKALYTLFPWAFLAALVLLSPAGGRGNAIAGMLVVAVPLAILNTNLPDFQPWWLNYWVIPWGEVVVVVVFILLWQRRNQKAA